VNKINFIKYFEGEISSYGPLKNLVHVESKYHCSTKYYIILHVARRDLTSDKGINDFYEEECIHTKLTLQLVGLNMK
jgi:hypothetical protein